MAKTMNSAEPVTAAPEEKIVEPQVDHAELRRYVKMYIPSARPGEEQSIFVSVNGYGTLVPRGKTVTLPRYVADHLAHVLRAEDKYEREVAMSHQKKDEHINAGNGGMY